jgi:hypothetical protein
MEIKRILIEAGETGASVAYHLGGDVTGVSSHDSLESAVGAVVQRTGYNDGWVYEFLVTLFVGALVGAVIAWKALGG